MAAELIRSRSLGIPFLGCPGPLNAITDVSGVEVGHCTLIEGEGRLEVGKGPVRTGITAVLPRGRQDPRMVFGGSFALNASGEMTGLSWLDERGFLEGPIMITNTHSVGVVRDATIQWMLGNGWDFDFAIPIVGETYDGRLNDINGAHIRPEHAWQALSHASGGMVQEGGVGGGTGMMCYEFKGGIGTSSRRLPPQRGGYTVGVLVQSNYGLRSQLRIGGLHVGPQLGEDMPYYTDASIRPRNARYSLVGREGFAETDHPNNDIRDGSIIVIVATDAPLLPHQLKRLAKRPALALGHLGGVATESSGDIFVAFSTANAEAGTRDDRRNGLADRVAREGMSPVEVMLLPNGELTPLFDAVVNATEEAIINSMVCAQDCTGANGLRVSALPHAKLIKLLMAHNLINI